MADAYINKIATSVPDHDIHSKFVSYVPSLITNDRDLKLFERMAKRSQIEHRYSFLRPHAENTNLDEQLFYKPGNFPDTQTRMKFYEHHALGLAKKSLDQLNLPEIKEEITHLIVTSCTGFYAPGLDHQIVEAYGLNPSVERTIIGFMGCYAAMNALKLARHIVRSEPTSKVLVLNLELCTLHLKEVSELEQMLSFLIFADGCSASIISSEPNGIELQNFTCTLLPDSSDQITWHIGQLGFDMILSGQVPNTISSQLQSQLSSILGNKKAEDIEHWAVHPGGRTVLDAVEETIGLPKESLLHSREILRRFGNMSSATVMFVLKEMLHKNKAGLGCGMAFGPGLTVESMQFQIAGA
jgi:predicted naringenin-chalcone synthase